MMMFLEYAAFMGLLILSVVLILRIKGEERVPSLDEKDILSSTIVKKLYSELVSHGLRPALRHQVGKYQVDVAFPSVKIAVEAVEHDFLVSSPAMNQEWEKDEYLRNHGWKILRFSGARIEEDLPRVVEKISRELSVKSNSSS
ncbi:UNVERIFIED_CONTAM: DUF559 domain-containing protein [Halobacillus marinus]